MKIIKNESGYRKALASVEELMNQSPDPGTTEADKLELLTVLVEDYESKKFPMSLPDPVDAIRFRMEQQNLKQRDLIPYIGSRSKVSEVLSGKRSLTLPMIRALNKGLEIPANVLLQNQPSPNPLSEDIQWDRFPIKIMKARGWFGVKPDKQNGNAAELISQWLAPLKNVAVLFRRTNHIRMAKEVDKYALLAWTARVLLCANESTPKKEYNPGTVTLEFMRETVRLSRKEDGPLLAKAFLEAQGISLVIEQHLPGTHLDGAAIFNDRPVIGLSLRFDRLDNFWFCLLHELAHISKHEHSDLKAFYDDLEAKASEDSLEQEADALANEAIMTQEEWRQSRVSQLRSPEAVQLDAADLGVHPAIVAGQVRYRTNSFQILNQMVGHGEVRRLFSNVQWSKRQS